MDQEKRGLIQSAVRLVKIGRELEAARKKLKRLVDKGVSYESAELEQALSECQKLSLLWEYEEEEHLAQREKVK